MIDLEYKTINAVLDQKDLMTLMTPNSDELFSACGDIWVSIKSYYTKYHSIPPFDVIQDRFPDLPRMSAPGDPKHYLDSLRDWYIGNKTNNLLVQYSQALQKDSAARVLEQIQGDLYTLSRLTNASRELNAMDFEDASRHYEEVRKRAEEMGGTPGIPTGISFIDSAYTSGLSGGDLAVVLGWAQPHSEPILTPDGWTTMGDLKVGDYVIGSDGEPTKVLETYERGVRQVYRVGFSDGTFVDCDKDHLWTVQTNKLRHNKRGWKTLSTEEIAKWPMWSRVDRKATYRYYLPLPAPVVGTKLNTVVGPYLMGQLLSDGCLMNSSVYVTTNDEESIKIIREENPHIDVREATRKGATARQWRIGGGYRKLELTKLKGIYAHEKSIPAEYMMATPDERLALLRGLMDGDGSIQPHNKAEYFTTSPRLAEDVAELVRSLGGTAKIRFEKRGHRYKSGVGAIVSIWTPQNPFGIERKANRYFPTYKGFKAILSVTAMDAQEPMKCIKVAADDNLYITRHYTLTHNTSRGKSLMTTIMACNAYTLGFRPMIVSLEMSPEKVRDRIYTILGNGTFRNSELAIGAVNVDSFRSWSSTRTDGHEFWVMSNDGMSDITPNVIQSKIDQHNADMVVVDYAQLCSDNSGMHDMTAKMRNMSMQFKALAVANNIPVVLISSATPDSSTAADAPPTIEQVAWSKQLAYDADLAMAVHKHNNSNLIEIVCRKNRNGELFAGGLEGDIDRGIYTEVFDFA